MTMKHICGARLSSGLDLIARFFATDAKMPSTFDFRTVYSIGEKINPISQIFYNDVKCLLNIRMVYT